MPQTAEEIEREMEEKKQEYLETAVQCYEKEIKNLNEMENEEKRNLIIKATVMNEGMIVDDKITFKDWYVDEEFQSDNVKISDDKKAYIDDLIERTIGVETIEIIEPIVKDNNDSREATTFEQVNTFDEILLSTTGPNNEMLKKGIIRWKKLWTQLKTDSILNKIQWQ